MVPPPPLAVKNVLIRLSDVTSALQELADGSHVWDSRLTITLGTYFNRSATSLTGMRFKLPIPQRAVIVAAFISFICTPDPAVSEPTSVAIAAELTDDASPFPHFEGEFGVSTAVLASRSILNVTAEWTNVSCDTDGPIVTPDLSDMIQPLMDRLGWSSGQHLAFHFNSSGGPVNVDGPMADSPYLVVYYLEPSRVAPDHLTDFLRITEESNVYVESKLTHEASPSYPEVTMSKRFVVALRFKSIPIPPQAKVVGATLALEVAHEDDDYASCIISAERTVINIGYLQYQSRAFATSLGDI